MTSNISFFSIMKEDFRSRSWMAAFSCLGSFLALPVFFLLMQQHFFASASSFPPRAAGVLTDQGMTLLQEFFLEFFSYNIIITQGLFSLLSGIIIGIFSFRYLNTRKASDLFHSVPVSRNRLFLSGYLNGLLIWLIPYLLCMAATLLLCLVQAKTTYWQVLLLAAGKSMAVSLLVFLMVYHVCLLSVMISGSSFAAIVAAILLGTGVSAVYLALEILCSLCLDTFILFPVAAEKILWASPITGSAIILINIVVGNRFDVFFMAASLLLTIGNFAAAWQLFRSRPSELAEQGIRHKWFLLPFRLMGTFTIGAFGFLLLMSILDNGGTSFWWYLFGTAFSCVLSFGVLNAVFQRNFKAFFTYRRQMAVFSLFTLLVIFAIYYDWTGYDTRIPSRDNIVSASVFLPTFSDSSSYYVPDENGFLLKQEYGIFDMVHEDADAIYDLLSGLSANHTTDNPGHSAAIGVRLKTGGIFYRVYDLTRQDEELLRPFLDSKEYQEANYKLSLGKFPSPDRLFVTGLGGNVTYSLEDRRQIETLMDAYEQDFQEHYHIEELQNDILVAGLETAYFQDTGTVWFNLRVPDNYANTLQALKILYPDLALSKDEVEIVSLQLVPEVDRDLPREALYSYFGLPGYPSYKEYIQEALYEGSDYDVENPDTDLEMYADYSVHYGLVLTDADDISELTEVLHIGSSYVNPLFSDPYVYVGEALTSSGTFLSCYVETGKMPEKWVEAIQYIRN